MYKYHTQANDQDKMLNLTIVSGLRHYVVEHGKNWDNFLLLVSSTYSWQIYCAKGRSAFSLLLTRNVPELAAFRSSIPPYTLSRPYIVTVRRTHA